MDWRDLLEPCYEVAHPGATDIQLSPLLFTREKGDSDATSRT